MNLTRLPKPSGLLASTALALAFGATLQAGEASAQAVSCKPGIVGNCTTLTVGDKIASAFSFVKTLGTFALGPDDEIKFSFDAGLGTYQLQLDLNPDRQINFSTGPMSVDFFYTLAITPAGLANGNTFAWGESNITGSALGGGSFSTTVTSPILTGSVAAANGASPTNPAVAFVPNAVIGSFKQVFEAKPGSSVSSLGFSFTQNVPDEGPDPVPGPLPILGAGAAFAFSRKLRQRIRQTA